MMDGSSFDQLVRRISAEASRRGLLRSAFAATVAGLGVASVLGSEDAEAKKSCKKKCKRKNSKEARKRCKKKCKRQENAGQGKQNGELCGSSSECSEPNNICALPLNDSGGDERCCGATGAACGGDDGNLDDIRPFCCQGFVCSTDGQGNSQPGTCQPAP